MKCDIKTAPAMRAVFYLYILPKLIKVNYSDNQSLLVTLRGRFANALSI